ncbi:hypothetical protein [Oerskovia sp. Root918]|uniref:hypothetical protein n=1 Tax=Oerskovia sp. Root918 TaxID=1736607 RepID=UPI000B163249|nr:hypothetical protein [Oerskovia sp. Root918]
MGRRTQAPTPSGGLSFPSRGAGLAPVVGNVRVPSRGEFSGTIHWAQIDLGDDDHGHLIDPEDQLAAAMRHQ